MDRHQARFAKLALTDHQHPRLPIDVRIVQGQGLTDTEAGGREQTEQRGVRSVPESFAGGKFPGHLEQSPDLLDRNRGTGSCDDTETERGLFGGISVRGSLAW